MGGGEGWGGGWGLGAKAARFCAARSSRSRRSLRSAAAAAPLRSPACMSRRHSPRARSASVAAPRRARRVCAHFFALMCSPDTVSRAPLALRKEVRREGRSAPAQNNRKKRAPKPIVPAVVSTSARECGIVHSGSRRRRRAGRSKLRTCSFRFRREPIPVCGGFSPRRLSRSPRPASRLGLDPKRPSDATGRWDHKRAPDRSDRFSYGA